MSLNFLPFLAIVLLGLSVTVNCGWQDFLPIKVNFMLPFKFIKNGPPPHDLEHHDHGHIGHNFVEGGPPPPPAFEANPPVFEGLSHPPIVENIAPVYEPEVLPPVHVPVPVVKTIVPVYHPQPPQTNVFFVNNPKIKYLPPRFTEINFFFKENLWGKPKHFVLKDKCTNVPASYFHEKPRSLWASDCVMVYKKDFCWGEGVRIAGRVGELRSIGLYHGISSVKPCERNIQITFKKGHKFL